jgi:hypothetical protein
MFLADNGAAWTISGAPDPRWNDLQLAELDRVPASAFEMVDEQPLVSDVNLGMARQDVRPGDLPVGEIESATSPGSSAAKSPPAAPAAKQGASGTSGAPAPKKN